MTSTIDTNGWRRFWDLGVCSSRLQLKVFIHTFAWVFLCWFLMTSVYLLLREYGIEFWQEIWLLWRCVTESFVRWGFPGGWIITSHRGLCFLCNRRQFFLLVLGGSTVLVIKWFGFGLREVRVTLWGCKWTLPLTRTILLSSGGLFRLLGF